MSRANVLKLPSLRRIALSRYCASPLKSLVSSAFVAQKDDILYFEMTVKGQRLFLKLIHNIMLPIPTLSVWDKIMKLNLNVFPSSI